MTSAAANAPHIRTTSSLFAPITASEISEKQYFPYGTAYWHGFDTSRGHGEHSKIVRLCVVIREKCQLVCRVVVGLFVVTGCKCLICLTGKCQGMCRATAVVHWRPAPGQPPMIDRQDAASCRPGCGACCTAPSISSPIPGMPNGKPAGVRCIQLAADQRCLIFGKPERPACCSGLQPSAEMCGDSREQAIHWLADLERATAPA